jgi:RNA polymerase sigma factor (sigma-70 family)
MLPMVKIAPAIFPPATIFALLIWGCRKPSLIPPSTYHECAPSASVPRLGENVSYRMGAHASHPVAGEPLPIPPGRDAITDYSRLLAALATRARWLGSNDPESAAQEALKRSLENRHSQSAIEYYFGDSLAPGAPPPEWPLDQLFAWLHGVLHYVVKEERRRVTGRREIPIGEIESKSPAPDQLARMIEKQLQDIVVDCFPKLDREYRDVLRLRLKGLKYSEIATRLGVSENTVATWVSRGIRALAQSVRRRTSPAHNNNPGRTR